MQTTTSIIIINILRIITLFLFSILTIEFVLFYCHLIKQIYKYIKSERLNKKNNKGK